MKEVASEGMMRSRDRDGTRTAGRDLTDRPLVEELPLERTRYLHGYLSFHELERESCNQCGHGDWLLVSFFVLVGAGLLALSLVTGFESVLAENCTANATCTYVDGVAFSASGATIVASRVSGGRAGCCAACEQRVDCAAAVFLNHTAAPINCLMYPESTADTSVLAGASLCTLPSGDGALSSTRGHLEILLGASTLLTRLGGFAITFILSKVSACAGYDGVGLVRSVLSPRQAGAVAAAITATAQMETVAVPAEARWGASP